MALAGILFAFLAAGGLIAGLGAMVSWEGAGRIGERGADRA